MGLKTELKGLKHRAWTSQLYKEFDQILYHYRLKLKRPAIQIATSTSYWGQWDPLLRLIRINEGLMISHPWDVVVEVLKHEVAHQIVNELYGIHSHTHDSHFQKACDRIAVAPWARRATGDINASLSTNPDSILSKQELKLLRKFEKLIALSNSENQNEATIAKQAATLLKNKYDLNFALSLKASNHCYITVCHKKKVIPYFQTRLTALLVEYFDVEVVFTTLYNPSKNEHWKAFEILGMTKNVRLAEYFYHYIWRQLPILWMQYKTHGGQGRNKRSYYMGVISGLGEKLAREHSAHIQSLSQNALLEMKEQELISLQNYLHSRHPRIHRRSSKGRLADEKGFQEGKKRGSLLDFRPGLNRGTLSQTPLLR